MGETIRMTEADRAIARLATNQRGVFTREQARSAGMTRSSLQRRLRSGRWQAVAPGVLAVAGAPDTGDQRLWIALLLSLGPDALASFESAGRLHVLDAMPPTIAVTVPHYDHRRRGAVTVHQQRVHLLDRTKVDGVPVTTVERTLCDLAMMFSITRLRHVVQTAHLERKCTIESIGSTLLRVGTIGRPGSAKLIDVLDEMGPGEPIPRTHLEAKLDDALEIAGLPMGTAQPPLPGTGCRSGLVDRAFPEAKLIVEADGRRWHARNAAMVADRERDFEAARAGWQTVRLMFEQLDNDPDDIALGLRQVYADRLPAIA